MTYPTESTYVDFNGKKYLLCVGGNVRLQVKRNGQFHDKWFEPNHSMAQKVAKAWNEMAGA